MGRVAHEDMSPHQPMVPEGGYPPAPGYSCAWYPAPVRAKCSCGWEGDKAVYHPHRAWLKHRREAARLTVERADTTPPTTEEER